MNYSENYHHLKDIFYQEGLNKKYDTIEIHERNFESLSQMILPGAEDYFCTQHQLKIKSEFAFNSVAGTIKDNVHIKDIDVTENHKFKYRIFKPAGVQKAKKVTLLIHGFNEKNWDKYLPWAKSICETTQSAVILFPLAFHMQRAPKYWSDKRKMYELSQSRNQKFPNVVASTLSNVAISMRLHAMPQRFMWSGLQAYYDVIQLLEECKSGQNEHIDKDFGINIPVEELNFDYPYSHENPFPLNRSAQNKINDAFKNVFQKVGDFYNSAD